MKFKTAAGTTYELTDIKEVQGGFTATLERAGVALASFTHGHEMPPLPVATVGFHQLPEVGYSFAYSSPTHDGCISTRVEWVEE